MADPKKIMLSENFSLHEMTYSATAERKGVPNLYTDEIVERLRFLCTEGLQPIREAWGRPITVNSGYRCPKVNELVGGTKSSAHMVGYAADITTGSKTKNKELFELIRTRFSYDQLIDENDLTWIHYSLKPSGNRMEVKRMRK